jgi:hypothetical protein
MQSFVGSSPLLAVGNGTKARSYNSDTAAAIDKFIFIKYLYILRHS